VLIRARRASVSIDAMTAAEFGARFRCDQCPDRPAPATIEPWSQSHGGMDQRR
jgi:hypothetical protein